MKELIDKSAVVAEIKKCYNECLKRAKIVDADYWNGHVDAYSYVLAILDDTLEVKEVDLDIAIDYNGAADKKCEQCNLAGLGICDAAWCSDYERADEREVIFKEE